jgi:hypothetical protein
MADDMEAFAGIGNQGVPQSAVNADGVVTPERSGLILAHGGMEKLQKKLATGEPRYDKRHNWRRDGLPVTEDKQTDGRNDSLRGTRVWMLSDFDSAGKPTKNFCPDCGRNDINVNSVPGSQLEESAPGITMVDANRPDIDLHPGSIIYYFHCARCLETQMKEQEGTSEPDAPLLCDPYGNPLEDEREREVDRLAEERACRMRDNTIEWIKAAKLRGMTYYEIKGT